ncbi:MAG: hypothetical protein IJW16_02180 [Clostridia bacterium]|nr:hypothetical protein [Clostridia bacterium]
MEIENQTAQTTVEDTEVGTDAGTATQNQEQINDTDFESGTDAGAHAQAPAAEGDKPTQKDVKSSENAQRRREAEQQKAIREARVQATIEALKGINPYTEKPMKDSDDVEEFLAMREIEKRGGDPVGDFSEYHKNRERDRRAQEQKAEEDREWFQNDREAFIKAHPDVNFEELIRDEHFALFVEGKLGKRPLSELYESYQGYGAEHEKRARERAAQTLANAKASPGSLTGAGSAENVFFTREQVRAMSREEIHKNYDKIMASMKKWK